MWQPVVMPVSYQRERQAKMVRQHRQQWDDAPYPDGPTPAWVCDLAELCTHEWLYRLGVPHIWQPTRPSHVPDFRIGGLGVGLHAQHTRYRPTPAYTLTMPADRQWPGVALLLFAVYDEPGRDMWLLGGCDPRELAQRSARATRLGTPLAVRGVDWLIPPAEFLSLVASKAA